MQVSAEVRWFWSATLPPRIDAWFRDAPSPDPAKNVPVEERTDVYFADPDQAELGLKLRGGNKGVEVKGLVAVIPGGVTVEPFAGPVEVWTKWVSGLQGFDPPRAIEVDKKRRLRKFDTTGGSPVEIPPAEIKRRTDEKRLPARGCNVELTAVTAGGILWWTLGFESFGSLETVAGDLRAVADGLAGSLPPEVPMGLRAGYPAWLGSFK